MIPDLERSLIALNLFLIGYLGGMLIAIYLAPPPYWESIKDVLATL